MDMVAETMEVRLTHLETARRESEAQSMEMILLIEDHEDRGRQNNVRIRGIPESEGAEDVSDTVQALFALILERPDQGGRIRVDRAYRLAGARYSMEVPTQRNIICRVHYFEDRETLIQAAWKT